MSVDLKNVLDDIARLHQEAKDNINRADSLQTLQQLKIDYLAKKGKVTVLFAKIGQVDPKDRPTLGEHLNRLKTEITDALQQRSDELATAQMAISDFDPSLPGRKPSVGGLNPLLQVMDEIKSIFIGMGFRIEEGPEIETEYNNFVALNMPEYHPARDMQDTFYLPNKYLLRTHTSPVQIRTMESQKPPVRMIAPGRCFRKDTPDATHSPTFHQVEGLCVDKNVSFADLKGVVQAFATKLFGNQVKVRFRPSFFPFTEPSAEYDFSCVFCNQKGCRFCKNTGWLEISGAGMVDPAVFGFVGYDPEVYTGYAFGLGVERVALLKYQIDDIRTLYENDLRYLEQF
jgi:phenylalanyl-tRNA synthetase alpha chain